jgi:hypothetical protein
MARGAAHRQPCGWFEVGRDPTPQIARDNPVYRWTVAIGDNAQKPGGGAFSYATVLQRQLPLIRSRALAHAMPCHHNLETYLTAYIEGAGVADDPKGPLFRTIGRGTRLLTRTPLPQANAYAMIGRRAAAAGIETKLGNHSFRATGITAYLKTAARWKRRRKWRTTPARARRSFMTADARNSASMKWRELGCDRRWYFAPNLCSKKCL